MRELERPVAKVWRRLRFQRFLAALVWCWAATLLLASLTLAVEKFGARPIPGADWVPPAVALAVGLVIAVGVALASGPSRVEAAVALDRAFALDERLSTALTLPADLRQSAAGRALMADALRHAESLYVAEKFAPQLPRLAWLPVLVGLGTAAIVLVPEWRGKRANANTAFLKEANKEVVAKQSQALGKKIARQRQEIDKGKFAEAEKLLAQVEKAADDLAKAPPAEKDKALVALNKIADALKDRQKAIGSPEQINRQLQQLREMTSDGPADQFAKDLSKGDFAKAAQELKKVQEKLLSGKMTEKEKTELKQQLKEMAKQMQKLANLEERKKQLEEAKKNGGMSQEQYNKEMSKLDEQSKQLKKMQDLAKKLGDAQQQMSKGDMKKAAEALGMSEQQLNEMAKQMQELQTLDDALADVQDAKNGMSGDGANQLGDDMNLGMNGSRNRMGNGQGGRGRGAGNRAEAEDNTAMYKTKVKQQITKGAAVLEGFAQAGKQTKGQSTIEIQGDVETNAGVAADALTNQKIPKNVEKHIRGYFDQINRSK